KPSKVVITPCHELKSKKRISTLSVRRRANLRTGVPRYRDPHDRSHRARLQMEMIMADDDEYIYDEVSGDWLPASEIAARNKAANTIEVRDSAGALLADGDSVVLIKDLKVKGAGQT